MENDAQKIQRWVAPSKAETDYLRQRMSSTTPFLSPLISSVYCYWTGEMDVRHFMESFSQAWQSENLVNSERLANFPEERMLFQNVSDLITESIPLDNPTDKLHFDQKFHDCLAGYFKVILFRRVKERMKSILQALLGTPLLAQKIEARKRHVPRIMEQAFVATQQYLIGETTIDHYLESYSNFVEQLWKKMSCGSEHEDFAEDYKEETQLFLAINALIAESFPQDKPKNKLHFDRKLLDYITTYVNTASC